MRRFQVTYADSRVEVIEADGCWPNDWGAAFVYETQRQSKSPTAKPGDIKSTFHTFRFIAGRLIAEVREIA
ncbi:hypothetical protein U91I_01185 [alpha proteobacterium U9-1i]|nr:hypothetical protein U91I_01185 [alpha proteobacterium U9-1i]